MSPRRKWFIIGLVAVIVIVLLISIFQQTPDSSMKNPSSKNMQSEKSSESMVSDTPGEGASDSSAVSTSPDNIVSDIIQNSDSDADTIIQDSENAETEAVQSDIDTLNNVNQTYDDSNF